MIFPPLTAKEKQKPGSKVKQDKQANNYAGLFKTDDKPANHRRLTKWKLPEKSEDLFANAVAATAREVCPEPIPGTGNIHFSWHEKELAQKTLKTLKRPKTD